MEGWSKMENGNLNPDTGEVTPAQEGGPAMAALVAKIIRATLKTGKIEKKGKNAFQNYSYITIEDLVAEVRRPLLEEGVFFYRSGCIIRSYELRASDDGKKVGTYVTLDLEFTLTDGNARLVLPATAEARDTGDKALQKAETSALKYTLMQNFLLQTNEDDLDQGFNADIPPPAQPQARQSSSAPKPVAGGKPAAAPSPAAATPPARAAAPAGAAQRPAAAPAQAQPAPKPPEPAPTQGGAVSGATGAISEVQMKKLRDKMAEKKQSETAVLRWAKVAKLEEMTEVQYKALCAMWRVENP